MERFLRQRRKRRIPLAPTESALAAGQKIYSKTCVMCHGKTGDADGPAVIESIFTRRNSRSKLATESTERSSGEITPGKADADIRQNDFPKQIAGILSITFDTPEAINTLLADEVSKTAAQAATVYNLPRTRHLRLVRNGFPCSLPLHRPDFRIHFGVTCF